MSLTVISLELTERATDQRGDSCPGIHAPGEAPTTAGEKWKCLTWENVRKAHS